MVNATERDIALACLIRTIGSPEFPKTLSHFVQKLAAFDNLIILVYCGEQNPVVLYREYTDPVVYLHMDNEYLGGAYLLDPFYGEHIKGTTTGIKRLIDVAPDQFKRTTYFNEYYKQTSLIDEIAIFAKIGPGTTVTACFGKDRSSNVAFATREIKKLKAYENVLSTLVEVHWKNYRPKKHFGSNTLPLNDNIRNVIEKENGVQLTPRQAEVAMLILRGHSSISIGLHLGISPETVKVFRRQLYAKCNISSQAELFSMMMPLFSRLSDIST